MKKLFGVLVVSLMQVTTAFGTPAFYKESILSIPEGIVVIGQVMHYYRNLQLVQRGNRDFRVVQGENLPLAPVDELSVAVILTEPTQVELNIVGHKSISCVELVTAVKREGNTFYFVVAESPLYTFDECDPGQVSYDITADLDVTELGYGDYLVKVNDEEIEFTLE